MRPMRMFAAFIVGATAFAAARADNGFDYVAGAEWRPLAGEVVIDTRPLADCKRTTLPHARCLPAEDFLGPHRRLPSERDILWLLGTVGLDGSEAVLIVGQDATARDFVAALVHLAGQRRVRVLTEPLARVLAGRSDAAPGLERGIIRSAVFTAPMRVERVVLKQEMQQEMRREAATATLLDGRSELEYWGESQRTARGGHLPGAVLLPAATLALAGPRPALPSGAFIAYAHDAYEGLAYFTRLVAGLGLPTRVYAGGWAEWAADGSLPINAATYPEPRAETIAAVAPARAAESRPKEVQSTLGTPTLGFSPAVLALAAIGAVLAAFAGGWVFAKRRMA